MEKIHLEITPDNRKALVALEEIGHKLNAHGIQFDVPGAIYHLGLELGLSPLPLRCEVYGHNLTAGEVPYVCRCCGKTFVETDPT